LNTVNNFISDDKLPQWAEILDAISDTLFWVTLALWGKTWLSELKFRSKSSVKYEAEVEKWVAPYRWSWHTIIIWWRDDVFSWEVRTWVSLSRALRKKWEIVMIQEDWKHWESQSNLADHNSQWIFLNMLNITGDPHKRNRGQDYRPAILAWADRADRFVINICRDFPLFGEYLGDNQSAETSWINISDVKHLVRHAGELWKITEESRKPQILLIIPEKSRQKSYSSKSRDDSVETIIQDNFPLNWRAYDIEYVSREQILVDMIVEQLQKADLRNKKIYIDTEGHTDIWPDIETAERCRDMIIRASNRIEWLNYTIDDIITDPDVLEKENHGVEVCILLREDADVVWGSSSRNREFWMEYVLIPLSTRDDIISHTNSPGEVKRIPILYNNGISKKLWEYIE